MSRALVLSSFLLLGCEGFVDRPTKVVFEPAATDFWSVPLPSALRTQADGTSNLERWPGARPALVKAWLESIDARLRDAWGVNSGVFFTLSGAVDPATLPQDASLALTGEASVQLVDVDPGSPEYGRRFPVDVSFTADEVPYRPANLLAVMPVQGFPRRESTTYAVILTDALKDTAGQPLGRTRAFHDALEKSQGADARAVEALAPLRDFLVRNKWNRARVVGGTVFRTIDPNATLKKLAAWVETQPRPTLKKPWAKLDEYPDFTLYAASYLAPHLQSGPKPGRGHVVWNADGSAPVQQGTQEVRLSISVPKLAAPASGYPLMLYLHGSGGEYREGMDRGPLPPTGTRDQQGEPPPGTGPAAWLAKRQVAVMGFDFPLHGDRETPPDTTGRQLYDLFGDVDSTIDNMSVAAMEVVWLTRLLDGMTVPLDGGGTARFDVTRLSAMGHSMGSTIGIPVATVDPRIKGYVFSGAGGLLLEVATETSYPLALRPAVELLLGFQQGQVLTRAHPLLNAFQSLWDFTDPVAKGRHVAREPYEGQVAKPYFLPQGLVDGYFHPGAQAAVGGALATTLVGPELDPALPRTLRLDGRGTLSAFPLRNNLNGVTAGTVQVQTPFELGHYVAFDVDAVRAQVQCFVLGVGTPEGPSIVSARALDAACN